MFFYHWLQQAKLMMLNDGCDYLRIWRSLLTAGSCTCFVFLAMLDGVLQNPSYYYQFSPPNVCLFLHSEMKCRYSMVKARYGNMVLSVLLDCVSTILLITFFKTEPEKCAEWTKMKCHQCVPSFNSVKCCNLSIWQTWVEMVNFIKPSYNTPPAA